MADYLSYQFTDNEEFMTTFDEAPLWSAYFGILLLKHLELKPGITVVDVGSGSGFPLMELAGRLGNSCKVYGIDPWKSATTRAKLKIKNYGLSNVEIIESSAEKMPFENNSIDLIVSNLGINNFEDPSRVLSECHRVLKSQGKLAITSNLTGHWKEFYEIFYSTLHQIDRGDLISVLKKDEEHRGTFETISKLLTDNNLRVYRHFEERFDMKFVDGSAFLNHYFIKLGWITTWMKLFPKEELPLIFKALEFNLNEYSVKNDGLTLRVPMLFIEAIKNEI